MPKFNQEQMGFEETGFKISADEVLTNKVAIIDFFSNNRNWYEILKKGGSTYSKVGLESQDPYDTDIQNDERVEDMAPLDPERINEGRANSISKFFELNPGAQAAFLDSISIKKSN